MRCPVRRVAELGSLGGYARSSRHPTTAGHQEMNMGMEDQGARPGVQHAQHAQLGAQPFGIGHQSGLWFLVILLAVLAAGVGWYSAVVALEVH